MAKNVSRKHVAKTKTSRPLRALPKGASSTAKLPLNGFPVVGVGASAGGLEAFTQLLKALPEDAGMALVFILHLDPEHKSMLPEILGRATRMVVTQARNGDHLGINHIYVIPPNTDLSVENLVLRLSPYSEARRPHLPVDHFLRSLAKDQGDRSIGIVLSGTGSDGTQGLEFIKAQGGITFAQRPDSAKYDGMPKAAIAAGCADFVLSPAEIAGELVRIGRHPFVHLAKAEKIEAAAFTDTELKAEESALDDDKIKVEESALDETELKAAFAILSALSNVDFTYYKHTTVRRRILRRMALHKIETLKHYVAYLKKQPGEVEALYQDILINVTSFFRDPHVFETLKQTLLPAIVKTHAAGTPIRIWVPGCSTGEEAYSIAMCLMEILPAPLTTPPQIFATDINDAALDKARAGVYRDSISADVSPERLSRFFIKLGSGDYQVCKAIREWCVFARQNVVRDPPFSKLDLIGCRNLLIYLGPALQKQVLGLFHYALTARGFLVLGSSESIGSFTDLFALEDKTHKFYTRKPTAARPTFEYSVTAHAGTIPGKRNGGDTPAGVDVQKAADLILLARVPASVLIDEEFEILQFRGHTGDYLEPASGNASYNLLKMARAGLLMALRTAIHEAKQTGLPVRKEAVAMENGKQPKLVDIEVLPVKTATARWHFLVLFEEKKQIQSLPVAALVETDRLPEAQRLAAERQFEQLKHELAATKDFLLAASEEEQSTTEELKASNEEILSSNEELLSTNEELETAKGELLSSNEELKTVNDELQKSLEQTARAKEYMEAVVDHMSKALLVLDGKLRVKKVNQAFCRMFLTSPAESENKLIYDLGSGQWNVAVLRDLLEKILPAKTELKDFEVTHEFPLIGRRVMLLDAHAIHWGAAHDTVILLAFEDISERKRAEIAARENEGRKRLLAVEKTANRAKDEFIATLSHELRTPLSAIVVWAKLLRGGQQNAKQTAKGLEVIERSAKSQTQLIEDLLDVSAIVAGKLRIELRPVEFSPVVEAALNIVRPLAEAKGIQLEAALDPTVVQISGDAARLQQIILNLLTNAIKFTPKGGRVSLTWDSQEVAGEVETIKLTVSDTGIGIPPDFLPHIFERFRQASGNITRAYSGLGLGLAIVRHLVELHHGTVVAQSKGEGKGATFTVTLPVLTLALPSHETKRPPQRMEASNLPLQGVRILAVEDDADARYWLQTVLEQSGAESRITQSAHEAFALLGHWRPDILVCDIGLPGEDGYSLMRRIRALEPGSGKKIPALALTAYARDEDRAAALAAGFQQHISKPPDPTDLVNVIAALNDHASAQLTN